MTPYARSYPLALVALATIGFVSVLVSSVTSMALASLAEALDTSTGAVVWVTTVFLLAAGVALPVSGWAVDRYGARSVLLLGVVVFAVGSLLSGLAGSFPELLAARVLQGLGGGALEPACLALLSRITDPRRIGAAMGLVAVLVNVAPAIGPVVGAALLSTGDWRLVFWFAVPPTLLAAGLLVASVRHDGPADGDVRSRLDVPGLVLLAGGFTATMLGLTVLAEGSTTAAALAGVLGLGLLTGYGRYAVRVADPVIDPWLLADRRVAGATGVMAVGGFLVFSVLTVTPLLAARVWDLDGLGQAAPLCAFGGGMLVSMSLAGALSDRTGPRVLVTTGATGTAVMFAVLAALLWRDAPVATGLVALGAAGLALGGVSAPTLASVYRVLPAEVVGAGTTAVLIAVQLGASLGVTAVGGLVEVLGRSAYGASALLLAGLALVAGAVAGRTLPGPPTSHSGPVDRREGEDRLQVDDRREEQPTWATTT